MKYLIPLLLVVLLVPSCYPDYSLTTEDYRTVVTLYDQEMYDTPENKAQLTSFYLIDSVFHVLNEGEEDTITRKYDRQLLDYVASNFRSLNWQQVTDTAGGVIPSTAVRVSVSSSTTIGYYFNYWGGWYPWYGGGWWGYPGWGWGGYYPPYWGSGGTYSYTTGSVFVQQDLITLPANPADSVDLKPIWVGSSNGLLSSSTKSNLDILAYEIRQMFTQSPYLAITPQP